MSKQHPVTILHVDDNAANRYVVMRMLGKAGFEVKEAATGEAGLQSVAEQAPDLIILDVRLPGIDGFEVCHRLKTNPITASIPVLHLSASFVESKDRVQGLEGGADGYLAQPVEPIELVATVKALLRIREAEESALILAKEWQTTFDAISHGVCLLDKQGKVLRANNAMANLINKPFSEIKDNFYQALIQEQLGCLEVPSLTQVQETHRRENVELQCGKRWFSFTTDPVFNEQGIFIGAVYIINEITERKSVSEALRASEERFRLLLENVLDYAIIILDPQGYIVRWSAGAERIFGYQEAEILGKPNSILFIPEDLALSQEVQELQTAIIEGRAEDERWHLRKDGSRFWGSGIATPLRDEMGQLKGFSKILRDFTEQKRVEDERAQLLIREQEARATAEAANRMKDEFLATLSHELRSPLNAMLGWLRLLNTRKFDEATTARAMETIERNAKTQAQLVEDLLDVSRIIQGKLTLQSTPVQLASLVETVLDNIRPVADAKAIQLQSSIDRTVGSVSGDSDRLQQVLWNLLTNAIKFTSQEGRVAISLKRAKGYAEITVTDTGKGISADFLPYVFDRFRQADSSITRSYTGLGLGLAIVRHLVELHGGSVSVDSPGEGKGATFKVKLPLIDTYLQNAQKELGETDQDGVSVNNSLLLDGLQILVVDDEADTRLFLRTVLEECGASVTTASSAAEAIEVIKHLSPDVLVSDIGMPEEDGYTFIRKVRKLEMEKGRHIPAAALTAYARSDDKMRSLAAGFQMHMAKPVEPAELALVVASLAGRIGFQ